MVGFLHEYELAVIKALREGRKLGLGALAKSAGLTVDKAMWAVENLRGSGMVEVERRASSSTVVTDEGKRYLKRFPEEELIRRAKAGPMRIGAGDRIALVWAKKNGWVEISEGKASLTAKGREAVASDSYGQRELLAAISSGERPGKGADEQKAMEALVERGLVDEIKGSAEITVSITANGRAVETDADVEGIGALTRELISGGRWREVKFRGYDIGSRFEEAHPARLHPMHEFINVIREIWLRMGFMEMSGPIIESSFWNFDALFAPQDHPTREMQDTFFISNPRYLDIEDVELLGRVRRMHSQGWNARLNDEISRQAVLRTHVTSVSARHIRKFAETLEESYPIKLFSVGRVFRNETVDYKHLAEFYQTEGIIIGNNLTLSNLKDTLTKFYSQLGIDNIRIKPSYFPFTEPSLEVHYYDEKRGSEIEIGGAGIIREEITKAMGTNKSVLAWGLTVDRLLLKFMDIETLSELYGSGVGWLRGRRGLEV